MSDGSDRWRALVQLSLAEMLALSLWFSASAVLPALSREWALGDGGRAGLTIAVLRRPSDDRSLSDTLLTHLGVEAGPRWLVTRGLLLGVSGLLGLHVLSFRDADEVSLGLGAGGAGLVEVRMTEAVWLYAQLGVLAQPSGGHEATDVTFAPTPLAIVGFSAMLPPR